VLLKARNWKKRRGRTALDETLPRLFESGDIDTVEKVITFVAGKSDDDIKHQPGNLVLSMWNSSNPVMHDAIRKRVMVPLIGKKGTENDAEWPVIFPCDALVTIVAQDHGELREPDRKVAARMKTILDRQCKSSSK
jgi:hypothetical protein